MLQCISFQKIRASNTKCINYIKITVLSSVTLQFYMRISNTVSLAPITVRNIENCHRENSRTVLRKRKTPTDRKKSHRLYDYGMMNDDSLTSTKYGTP